MVFARRTAALRLTAMAALGASAVLISDGLHPDRAFCPLEQACEAARASALGTLFGVPTSVLGALAFGGLFFLTLLPVEWGRRLLQLAGFLAAVAGAGFIVYQAMVLKTFCPLCLVADGAGLLAGLITLTWPAPPIRVSGRRLRGEAGTSRLAWTLAGVLAVALPMVWPRPDEPSWVEIPEQAWLEEEPAVPAPRALEEPVYGSATLGPAAQPAPDRPHPTAFISVNRWRTPEELAAERNEAQGTDAPTPPPVAGPAPTPAPTPTPASVPAPAPATTPPQAVTTREPSPTRPAPPETAATPTPSETPSTVPSSTSASAARPAAGAAETATSARAAAVAKPTDRRRGPIIVEYLNAYCGHCRATHTRLEKVLREMDITIRRRRIYAWASEGYPLWVRACAYAKQQGAEERLFQELLRAPNQQPASVYAAARRAGLDVVALQCAIEDPNVPPELVRDCRRMKSAGLKGLPTLDIGRRRLMGDQSEAELREAIRIALANFRSRSGTP